MNFIVLHVQNTLFTFIIYNILYMVNKIKMKFKYYLCLQN